MGRPRLLKPQKPSTVPVAGYFVVVGGVLTVLLLIVGWLLPGPPAKTPNPTNFSDGPINRIRSTQKWPDKIVLDTDQPTMRPPPEVETPPAQPSMEPLSDETRHQARAESPAKPKADEWSINTQHSPRRTAHRMPRGYRSVRVVGRHNPSEPSAWQIGWDCCLPEHADRRTRSRGTSRRSTADRHAWMGWQFPEENLR